MKSVGWNPWHGCHKFSEGCRNCYVYRMDERHGKDSAIVTKTADFYLPVRHARNGSYKIPEGSLVGTCFTSDFLVSDADAWRPEAWRMMRTRSDCEFFFLTKRIERLAECLPEDWGNGYSNVLIGCTVENQRAADTRLPIYLSLPMRQRLIACEPLLGKIELEQYLNPSIESVCVGGESGPMARECQFEWVLDLRRQCIARGVAFTFHQTGANFVMNGKQYQIPRKLQHQQARKANINTAPAFQKKAEAVQTIMEQAATAPTPKQQSL